MKNRLLSILLFTFLSFAAFFQDTEARASHLTGADFQYICVGKDSILIRLNIFRDCSGIAAPTSVSVTLTNSCNQQVTQTLSLVGSSGIDISFLCGPLVGQSTCNGGSLQGMEIYTYEAIYVLSPSCGGEVQAIAAGGSPGYSYSWPMGISGTDVTDMCAGDYILTITDNNGCQITDTISMTDISNFSAAITVTEISCSGQCDGAISVSTPVNGTAPYTYSWSNGASTATISNLCPGMYSVTVMDSDGSQYAQFINLQNPAPIFINFVITQESCVSACDGVIRANVTGGTPPYTYAWTGGLSGNLNQNVCPGSYTLTVTDANGCQQTATATVNPATTLSVSVAPLTPISCNNGCNGVITATVSGGQPPYSYSWSNGATGVNASNLCAGSYTVTVTDANYCTAIQTYTLTQPTPISVTPTVTNSNCTSTGTGSISLSPSGGNAPYSYAWSITPNPGNVSTVTNLLSGSYTVTITDGNNCTLIKTIGVGDNGGPTNANVNYSDPSCPGGANGTASVSPTGGTVPYSYLWSTGATTSGISGLPAGTYVVTISGNNGCKLVEVIELTDPATIESNGTVSNPTCNGTCTGSITIAPTGGTGSYNIVWSNGGSGLTNTNLCSGTYYVTITDGNNCQAIDTFNVGSPVPLQDSIQVVQDLLCNGDCNGELTAIAYGGTAPYSYAWSNGASLQTNYDLCDGTYVVTITDANGCTITDTMLLTQPTPITSTITSVSPVGCSGLWTMGWSSCCRNSGISNIVGSPGMWAGATMNQTMPQGGCNSGVHFEDNPNAHPLRYVCLNDTLCYNFGVSEPDGDSLVFELIPARSGPTTNVTYQTGYSGTQPIAGITLDSNTGEICFVAQPVGLFVVTIKVTEYDPVSGLYKGENFRDIQFVIQNCPPNDRPSVSNIQNFIGTGGAALTDTNEISMCEGDSFCFQLTFLDSQLVDTGMYVFTNVQDWLNGPNPNDTATISNTVVDSVIINGDTLVRIVSTICWTAPPNSGGVYNFYVAASDDHCTVPKDVFRIITVNVAGSTVAWPDQTICGSQSAQLFAAGGDTFSWQSISGDPIIVGVNFSCDSCTTPVATPSQTTVYVVTSNLSSACQNTDTVTVTVAPDYQAIAGPDTILCNLDSIQMFAFPTISPLGFSYQWNNGSSLTNDTIWNPISYAPGTTTYTVTLTSPDGCVKNTNATITVLPPFPVLDPVATDTALCGVDTTQIDINFLQPGSSACGPGYSNCLSTTTDYTVGTGTSSNGTTTYPAPYGNFRRSAKHQFLYRASELTALGLSAGMITAVGFDILAISGTTTYQNFEIRMGCTSLNSLPSSFVSVPTIVFPSQTINISTGWNMHQFTTPYIWDGVSNLIVEVCFDMLSQNNTSNSATRYSVTPFVSSIYNVSNTANACNATFITNTLFQRPNTRFSVCDGADPAAYTYTWSPNMWISDTSIIDPQAWPDTTTTYTVVVKDTFGVCSDTADIILYVGEIDAGNDTLICSGDSIQLNATAFSICPNGTESFSWSPGVNMNDSTLASPTVQVSQTTTFYLTYTNSCGCTLTDSVTVFVNELFAPVGVLTHPTCGLSDGEILVQAVGGTAPYLYSIDSGNTFTIDSVFLNLPLGFYNLMVTDSNGCASPIRLDTLINPGAPVIDSIVPVDPSCFGNADGEIIIYATGGTPPLRYTIDSVNFGLNNHFSALVADTYTVIVMDDSLCRTFPEIIVPLVSNAEIIIDSIVYQDLNCYQDYSGSIQVFAHGGTPPLSYTIDSGMTYQSNMMFDSLLAGPYYVTVQDSKLCDVPAQLIILQEPPELLANINVTNDTCYNACGGFAQAVVSGGTPPYIYNWNGVGGNSPISNNLCAGSNYLFSVYDSNNCQKNVSFVVTQPPLLQIDSINADNLSCFQAHDGSIAIFVSGGTSPYTYSIDGGNTFTGNPVFTGLTAGTYNIIVRDSADHCETIDQVILTEPTKVEISPLFTQKTICVSNCVNISAPATGGTGMPYIYVWNQGLDSNQVQTVCPTDQTTVYTVYAVDQNGCASDPAAITIFLYDSLQIDAGQDVDICPGDTVMLNAVASGGDGNGYFFQWSPAAFLSNAFVSNPVSKPNTTITYTVTLKDNCGSPQVVDSVTVNVHPLPNVDFYSDDTLKGCEPFDVTLISNSNPVQFAKWKIGDDITAVGFTADITDLLAGEYDVTLEVISPAGCESSLTKPKYIAVLPKPTAKFTMNPEKTTVFNTIVQFEDQSSDDVVDWSWDFASFGSSVQQNPRYQFPADTGSFIITLDVVTQGGCENSTTAVLRIGNEFNFYVPNSFTPNGDGINDVFAPQGIGVDPDGYSLYVYDRWGTIVYYTKSLGNPWDGRYQSNNKEAENGVYVWKIVANDATDDSTPHEYTGTVTLIR